MDRTNSVQRDPQLRDASDGKPAQLSRASGGPSVAFAVFARIEGRLQPRGDFRRSGSFVAPDEPVVPPLRSRPEGAVSLCRVLAIGHSCTPQGKQPSRDNNKRADGHIWTYNFTKNQNADRGAEHQLQIGEGLYGTGLSHLVTANE